MQPLICIAALLLGSLTEDAPPPADPYDVTTYRLALHEPAMDAVDVTSDVAFFSDGVTTLRCDVYRPGNIDASTPLPAVVFVNGIGDVHGRSMRSWAIYRDWARAAAARGVAGITMSARSRDAGEDLDALLRFLCRSGDSVGVDGDRVALWMCSAHAETGLHFAMDRKVRELRAAAVLYGTAHDIPKIRTELPVLSICAGKDDAELIADEHALWSRAAEAGAPWTTIQAPRLPHAFDAVDPSAESRRLVRVTLDFLVDRLRREDDDAVVETLSPARRAMWSSYAHERHATLDVPPADVQDEAAVAMALIEAGQERRAIPRLTKLADRADAPSSLLRALGVALVKNGDYESGAAYLERAFTIGIPDGADTRGAAAFALACAHAKTGRIDEAFARLQEAAAQGCCVRAAWEHDRDLAALRADPRWAKLVAQAGT